MCSCSSVTDEIVYRENHRVTGNDHPVMITLVAGSQAATMTRLPQTRPSGYQGVPLNYASGFHLPHHRESSYT
jgi:hypothetical protein